MKRILVLLFLLVSIETGHAQTLSEQPFQPFSFPGAPFGACTNATSAINQTNGSLYYCLNGAWVQPAAPSVGAGPGVNNFSPTNYAGWFGDTREVLDATWAGGGSTITCTNTNDCNFTANDNGKLCWAIPATSAQAGPSAPGTFTFVSAQQGTCTASAVISSATNNGMFTWGHDDTAAWVSATAALYTQPKCGNLIVPAAHSMIKQGLSFTGTPAADCNVNITGYGYVSVIELEPGFSFSAVTNNVGTTSLGILWNTAASSAYLYFTVAGEFQSLSGISTAPATSLFTISAGGYAIGLNFTHWASAASNSPNGINVATGTGPFGIGVAFQDWGNGNFQCSATYCIGENDGGVNTFKILGGSLAYDYSGTFSFLYDAGGEFHGFGTETVANGGAFSSASCDLGSLVILEGAKIGVGTPAAGAIGWQFNNFGSGGQCILDSEGSSFKGSATGSAILSAIAGQGIFIDRGNNSFPSGPLNFSGTYVNMTPLAVNGACTGTATSSATLGLYGTGPNVTATTCTSAAIGSGIVMSKSATIYELLATDTAVGVNASSGAVTVLKNGATQTMTCTLGTLAAKACQDGATAHQISVVPGDLISIQFTTQAAEVLAGVKATLVID